MVNAFYIIILEIVLFCAVRLALLDPASLLRLRETRVVPFLCVREGMHLKNVPVRRSCWCIYLPFLMFALR